MDAFDAVFSGKRVTGGVRRKGDDDRLTST
jgi:hypothetical protein